MNKFFSFVANAFMKMMANATRSTFPTQCLCKVLQFCDLFIMIYDKRSWKTNPNWTQYFITFFTIYKSTIAASKKCSQLQQFPLMWALGEWIAQAKLWGENDIYQCLLVKDLRSIGSL